MGETQTAQEHDVVYDYGGLRFTCLTDDTTFVVQPYMHIGDRLEQEKAAFFAEHPCANPRPDPRDIR